MRHLVFGILVADHVFGAAERRQAIDYPTLPGTSPDRSGAGSRPGQVTTNAR
jgi:hypothetical protein